MISISMVTDSSCSYTWLMFQFRALTASKFRELGQLAKGMKADNIDDLPDSIVGEILDDINDVDMDDWKRKKFLFKVNLIVLIGDVWNLLNCKQYW